MKEYFVKITKNELDIIKDLMIKSNHDYDMASQFKYMSEEDYTEMLYFKAFQKEDYKFINNETVLHLSEDELKDIRFLLKNAQFKYDDLKPIYKKFDFVKSTPIEIEDVSDLYTNDHFIAFKKIKH